MQTLSPFIPKPHLPTATHSIQLLPSEAHSSIPLTHPQIHTLWLHALSLHKPLSLSFRPTITAHKYLLKHLLRPPSTPNHLTVPAPSTHHLNHPDNTYSLTPADLKTPAHSPHAFFLFLNLGLLYAFTGEYFLATRHFRTALGIDDGRTPGNTAVGHYLLGIAFYELKRFSKAVRAFHQCLLLFRRKDIMEGKPELVAAAPWFSPLVGGRDEERKKENKEAKKEGGEEGEMKDGKKEGKGKKEGEEGMWTGFKHKIYEPTTAFQTGERASKTSWKEWDLERKNVESNMQAAIAASGVKPPATPGQEPPRSADAAPIHGIPGGALFWPLEDGHTQDPSHAKVRKPSSSKPTKAVPPPVLLVPAPKKEPADVVGLGLQVPGQEQPALLTAETKGPKWNEETQTWEDYLSPLPPLSRSASTRRLQPPGSLGTSASATSGRKGSSRDVGDSEGETTPKAIAQPTSYLPGIQGAKTAVFETFHSSSMANVGGKKGGGGEQGARTLRRKTYSPSAYTNSPPETIGSGFLSYYGPTPSQAAAERSSLRGSSQSSAQPSHLGQRPTLSRPASSVEDKNREAWLALSGLADDDDDQDDDIPEDEDVFPKPTQPLSATQNSTVTSPSLAEGGTLSPRRRTIIHRSTPYPSAENKSPSPRTSTLGAAAAATFPQINVKTSPLATHASPMTTTPYTQHHHPTLQPSPKQQQTHTPYTTLSPNASEEPQDRSPASAILSIYGSLTPPDTAKTVGTVRTIFTPSPEFPPSSHGPTSSTATANVNPNPKPSFPQAGTGSPATNTKQRPPPHPQPHHHTALGVAGTGAGAPTPPATATPSSSSSRNFSASPLNRLPTKKSIPLSKSLPRGLGIGIAGLAGPEPAISLEEAMKVRAKRDEEAREEEVERKAIELEYRVWMRSLSEREGEISKKKEEAGLGEGGGFLLPARAFEGFGARKEAEKGGKGEGLGKEGYEGFVGGERSKKGGRVKEKKGPGEKEERAGEEDDDPEARWVKMAEAFHESTLKDA